MISRRAVCLGLVLALLASLQWLPLLHAKWSIRDDYRFVKLMGSNGRISFPDFVEQLFPPDVPLGGTVNRPCYYLVHDCWMLLIGNNLLFWQSTKILTYFAVVFLFFLLLRIWVDVFSATALWLFVSLQPTWWDIVPRANSELFALFGLALYGIGNSLLLRSTFSSAPEARPKQTLSGQFLAGLGGVIAVISKENFCFSILAISASVFLFANLAIRRRELALAQLVPFLVAVIFSCLVIYGMIKNHGHALYGQSFNFPAIRKAAFAGLNSQGFLGWLPVGLMAFHLIWFLRSRDCNMLYVAFFELILIGIVLLNSGFYTGFKLEGRYAFPINIVPAFAVIPPLTITRDPWGDYSKSFIHVFIWMCCISLVWPGRSVNYDWTKHYRSETRKFDKQLKKVVGVVSADPGKPILFESYSVGDVEPLASVKIYLESSGVHNPMYAKLEYSSDQFTNQHEKFLAKLTEDSIGPNRRFRAFSDLSGQDYFRISFSCRSPQPDVIANFYSLE
jgi:hypothetical protein